MPKVTVHKCAETIQGRKLYEEIRYLSCLVLLAGNLNLQLSIVIWHIFLNRIVLSDKKLPLKYFQNKNHSSLTSFKD